MSAAEKFVLNPEGEQPERGATIPLVSADLARVTQHIYQTINPLPNYRVKPRLKALLVEVCTLFENGKEKGTRRNRYEYSKTNKEIARDLGCFHMTVSKDVVALRLLGLLLVQQLPEQGNRRLLTPAPVLRNAYLYSMLDPLYDHLFPGEEGPATAMELENGTNPVALDPLTQNEQAPTPTRQSKAARPPSGPPIMNVHVGAAETAPVAAPATRATPAAPSRTEYQRKSRRVAADPPTGKPYQFPEHFTDPQLLALWERWGQCLKQKRRTHAVRQQELSDTLANFPQEYVITRLKTAIEGDHTAAWYSDRGPADFERWQREQGRGGQAADGPGRLEKTVKEIKDAYHSNQYDTDGNRTNRPDF